MLVHMPYVDGMGHDDDDDDDDDIEDNRLGEKYRKTSAYLPAMPILSGLVYQQKKVMMTGFWSGRRAS